MNLTTLLVILAVVVVCAVVLCFFPAPEKTKRLRKK